MDFFNHYSAVILGAGALLVTGWLLLRRQVTKTRILILTILAIGMGALWWLARPEPTPSEDLADLQAAIGVGQPVLLEFQSPY